MCSGCPKVAAEAQIQASKEADGSPEASDTDVQESLPVDPRQVDATLTGSTWLGSKDISSWVNRRGFAAIESAQARSLQNSCRQASIGREC